MRREYKCSKSKWRCLHFLLAFPSVRSHHPHPADKSTNTLAKGAAVQCVCTHSCKYIQIKIKMTYWCVIWTNAPLVHPLLEGLVGRWDLSHPKKENERHEMTVREKKSKCIITIPACLLLAQCIVRAHDHYL